MVQAAVGMGGEIVSEVDKMPEPQQESGMPPTEADMVEEDTVDVHW